MAQGLGFAKKKPADPGSISPVNPDSRGGKGQAKANSRGKQFIHRKNIYYNMMQGTGSRHNSGGYGGLTRSKANNDSGILPSAYLNYIER